MQEKLAALSVEEAEREIYTGMDNLLFEKAYTHMIDIVKKFPGIVRDAGTEEIAVDETVNPKDLFTTKKVNLMAMIAFLNGCYAAAASEHRDEASADEPTNPSQIIYQWSLMPSATSGSELTRSASAIQQEKQITVSNESDAIEENLLDILQTPDTGEFSEEYLMGLINIHNKRELLNLPKGDFNRRVKEVVSLRIRGKIRDLRTDYEFQIKEKQEQAEAIRRAAERETQLDRFYATMLIKKI